MDIQKFLIVAIACSFLINPIKLVDFTLRLLMTISVVDFFCGCGGTSAGLRLAGMKIVAGIDIDAIALKTFERNFPEAIAIQEDIKKLSISTIKNLINNSTDAILFSACAPCQPFSQQNRQKISNDQRESLLDNLHRFIEACKPDYILLENVPGLQKIEKGPFTRFLNLLDKLEYYYSPDVKDAKCYGVPQTRKRLVLIAAKDHPVTLPKETHGPENLKPYRTVWEAIGKYHPLQAGQTSEFIPNHQAAKISALNLERLKYTPEGGDRRSWPEELLLECHKKNNNYTDTYGRLRKNTHAATLTTKCISISNGRYGHPTQNRALTVREAAALQTFEDNFIFEGTLAQTARQVGNAVPVQFAKALGESIIKQRANK